MIGKIETRDSLSVSREEGGRGGRVSERVSLKEEEERRGLSVHLQTVVASTSDYFAAPRATEVEEEGEGGEGGGGAQGGRSRRSARKNWWEKEEAVDGCFQTLPL